MKSPSVLVQWRVVPWMEQFHRLGRQWQRWLFCMTQSLSLDLGGIMDLWLFLSPLMSISIRAHVSENKNFHFMSVKWMHISIVTNNSLQGTIPPFMTNWTSLTNLYSFFLCFLLCTQVPSQWPYECANKILILDVECLLTGNFNKTISLGQSLRASPRSVFSICASCFLLMHSIRSFDS
jgi:hypothetical protein